MQNTARTHDKGVWSVDVVNKPTFKPPFFLPLARACPHGSAGVCSHAHRPKHKQRRPSRYRSPRRVLATSIHPTRPFAARPRLVLPPRDAPRTCENHAKAALGVENQVARAGQPKRGRVHPSHGHQASGAAACPVRELRPVLKGRLYTTTLSAGRVKSCCSLGAVRKLHGNGEVLIKEVAAAGDRRGKESNIAQ